MTVKEYNECVDLHADGLYRFIVSNIRHAEDSQDIVQESFAKLWERRSSVGEGKGKSYLFTTAYHTMIDKIRTEKRYTEIAEGFEISAPNSGNYSDLQEMLHEALNKIPQIQKTVILLRDYEGYDYKEIGRITNLTESQVKVYIFRARTSLKKYIGKLENVI